MPDQKSPLEYATPRGDEPRRFVDYLRYPRLITLLLAILASLVGLPNGRLPAFTLLLWVAWLALGIVSIVRRANWKARQSAK